MLFKVKMDVEQDFNVQVDYLNFLKQFEYLDFQNQYIFEVCDLELLIQMVIWDFVQYDVVYYEEFKCYEMFKEYERWCYLELLGEEQRKEVERKLEE